MLVFDLQDIGCRSYTYISTMGRCMEAAGENKIPFVVLDRPNPVGGLRVEGPSVEPRWISFVGQFPIPYVHGLTVGELARMVNDRHWISSRLRSHGGADARLAREHDVERHRPALDPELAEHPARQIRPSITSRPGWWAS